MLWVKRDLAVGVINMEGMDDLDQGELVRRFETGERTPELMVQLNQAAFACFHAPWEALPTHGQEGIPVHPEVIQERLPLAPEHDGASRGDVKIESLGPLPGLTQPPSTPNPRDPNPTFTSDLPVDPLAALDRALEMMGRRGYLAQGHSLILDLPFDPEADNQSWMAFWVQWESQTIQVFSYGDLALWGLSVLDLEVLCADYNRENCGLEAVLTRPHKGARVRLRLVSVIPFELTRSLLELVDHLGKLFCKDREFWCFIRRSDVLPTSIPRIARARG